MRKMMEARPLKRGPRRPSDRGPRSGRGGDDRTKCRFCRARVEEVDYKDVSSLQKLVSTQGKFFSRKRSGNCAAHQRSAKRALKWARYLALMPYVGG